PANHFANRNIWTEDGDLLRAAGLVAEREPIDHFKQLRRFNKTTSQLPRNDRMQRRQAPKHSLQTRAVAQDVAGAEYPHARRTARKRLPEFLLDAKDVRVLEIRTKCAHSDRGQIMILCCDFRAEFQKSSIEAFFAPR